MITSPNFYALIIGTELLNGRRQDSHFDHLNSELLKRGWSQKASFVIKDDPKFLEDIFRLIRRDKDAVMFSFGGIGSTPDDFTREVAAQAFTEAPLVRHKEAEEIIKHRLGARAYPHPIKMADLPQGADLVENPVNQMPGFSLDKRFFFVPGFPQMAHPMVSNILDTFYPQAPEKFSCNFIVEASEARLIDIMAALPKDLELSCLPQFVGENGRQSEIYLAYHDKSVLEEWCGFFKSKLHEMQLTFRDI
jgi:molybdopterin-biosynthesis enzyme MoeA-like protein